jgi:hypothetical protein
MTAKAAVANTVGEQKYDDAEKIKPPLLIHTSPHLAQMCNARD